MQLATPIPRQSVGKTFIVAISILGVAVLAQLGAVGWAFLSRFHTVAQVELPLPLPLPSPALPKETAQLNPGENTFAPTDTSAASVPKPTPVAVPLPRHELTTSEGRLAELVDQARALRERGDTSTALTRLREAQTITPNQALVISELAITYEKMGLTDKAMEQWRRIYEMGESAGIYFSAADAKLKAVEAQAQAASAPPAPAPAKEMDGIQPGSQLGLGEMSLEEQADPTASRKFSLKIPIKARPNSKIDVADVVIQVFFYDMLDNKDVVQTNATVNYRWSTTPPTWQEDDIEILNVEYLQSQPDARARKAAEERKYFGYVVRVYYKKELQDMRADPVKLLKQYPPPLTLDSPDK